MIAALLTLAAILASTACATSSTAATSRKTPTPQGQHGVLYFAANTTTNGPSATGDIYALGLSDGKQLWHTSVGADVLVFGGATLYMDTVKVGSDGKPSSAIMALHASDGTPAWKRSESSGVIQALAADGDAVFVSMVTVSTSGAIASSNVEALRASDGTPLWSAVQSGPATSATVGDGAVYVEVASVSAATSKTPPTFNLLALDTSTGKVLWRLALQDAAPAPVLSGGVLYLAENNFQEGEQASTPTNAVMAVRASDGVVLWHTTPPVGASAASNIVVSGATVCYSYSAVNGPGGGIVALHTADGSLAWQAAALMSGPAPLAANNGVLYTVDQSKSASAALQLTLRAFDMSTGKSLFAHPFPSLPVQVVNIQGTPPQVADGEIYLVAIGVSGTPGTPGAQPQPMSVVVALSTSDGSLKWDHTLNGAPGQFLFVTP